MTLYYGEWFIVAQAKIEMTWTFQPIPRYNTETRMWYPSVKTLVNGQFTEWVEYELPCSFEDAKILSVQIAEEKKTIVKKMIGAYYGG